MLLRSTSLRCKLHTRNSTRITFQHHYICLKEEAFAYPDSPCLPCTATVNSASCTQHMVRLLQPLDKSSSPAGCHSFFTIRTPHIASQKEWCESRQCPRHVTRCTETVACLTGPGTQYSPTNHNTVTSRSAQKGSLTHCLVWP